ncbi:MAG: hypothetical protein LBE35_07850, partial [Clostridiales bacterium]|nr:hypothetical protein [Clostridiales bacterium]
MKILITAGGTSERIDDVRRIVNNSTGQLGVALAKAFRGAEIFYVRGRGAVSPDSSGICEFVVEDATGLERVLRQILDEQNIDVIVHAMAVSDFRVKERIEGKISSEIEEFTLTFVKTPKIIGLFRELAPKAMLVGFK